MAPSPIRPPLCLRSGSFDFNSDRMNCDVLIRVGDVTFLGHKMILTALSGYFHRELKGPRDAPIKEEVVLTDVNASAFGEILYFIYTDSVRTLEVEDFYELLRTFDVLEVHYPIEDKLMAGVEAIDMKNKPIRSAFSLLYHAEDTKRTALVEFMREHIKKHAEHFFLKDDDFLKVSHARLKVMVERRYFPFGKEDLVVDGINRWIHHSYGERKQYFVPLLGEVGGELAHKLIESHYAPIPKWKPGLFRSSH